MGGVKGRLNNVEKKPAQLAHVGFPNERMKDVHLDTAPMMDK